MARPITFLSDYGHNDEFAGVCRAVMSRIAPEARIVDITHGVPRHAVRQGAVLLANSLPYAEPGVHLAVIDPGVGSGRRPVAVRLGDDDRVLVGPDNGVLSPACARFGGALEAVDLNDSEFRLQPVAATFHGRDIFAPVAARLASGASLAQAGDEIDPASLTALDLPKPRVYPERVVAHVLYVDGFGNIMLNVGGEAIASTFLRPGDRVGVHTGHNTIAVKFTRTFSDVGTGQGLLYTDATGSLALAINRENAAQILGLRTDDEVTLSPAQ